MGNRFQDQALDMKENLKAIEENGTHLVLSPAASGFWRAPQLAYLVPVERKEGVCSVGMPPLHQELCCVADAFPFCRI